MVVGLFCGRVVRVQGHPMKLYLIHVYLSYATQTPVVKYLFLNYVVRFAVAVLV